MPDGAGTASGVVLVAVLAAAVTPGAQDTCSKAIHDAYFFEEPERFIVTAPSPITPVAALAA